MVKKLFLIIMLALLPVNSLAGESVVDILYTGGLRGELEPCGCSPKSDSGGLARLSGYLNAYKEKSSAYILVDAGNSMPEDSPQGRLKAEALLKSFETIGYDAVAFSSRDAEFSNFESFRKKYRVPSVLTGPIKTERGPVRINISGNPADPKKGMINVLLTGMASAQAGKVKGWDVIIISSGEVLENPVISPKGIIVSGYPRGQKLGVLTVKVDAKGRVGFAGHRWQELGKDIAEDQRVREVLKDYDAKAAALLRDEERKATSEGPYLGAAACAECHKPYVESWSATRHSGAFGSLERVGKSRNPECVKCHVTGFMQEGGFYSMTTTPGLANVQCEVCHGPGREHVKDVSKPLKPVVEDVCLQCHTRPNSPDFEFRKYYEKIRH